MYEIQDWAGNKPFGNEIFDTFDDAWERIALHVAHVHPNATEHAIDEIYGEYEVVKVDQ
jgi:hypothetical protein